MMIFLTGYDIKNYSWKETKGYTCSPNTKRLKVEEAAFYKQSGCRHLHKLKSNRSPSATAARSCRQLWTPRCCSGDFRVKPEGLYLNENATGKKQIHLKIQGEKTCFLRPIQPLRWNIGEEKLLLLIPQTTEVHDMSMNMHRRNWTWNFEPTLLKKHIWRKWMNLSSCRNSQKDCISWYKIPHVMLKPGVKQWRNSGQ